MADGKTEADKLEDDVAALYRQMGYTARQQVNVDGKNVDVVVERDQPGVGWLRTYVEVKHTSKKSVPVDEVRTWVKEVGNFRNRGDHSSSVMVTNAGYSPQGHQEAEAAGITLLTLRELEQMALGVDGPLRRRAEAYASNEIYRHYVDLNVTLKEKDPAVGDLAAELPASDLRQLALDHPDVGVLLFADFGAGKTTALERIHRDAVEARATAGFGPIPLMFQLKHFEVGRDLDSFIIETWKNAFGGDLPIQRFWELVEDRQLLLLLDGFDETTLRADAKRRAELLQRISPLLFGPTAAIMTTRPGYFVDAAEYMDSVEALRSGGTDADVGGGTPAGQRFAALMRTLDESSTPDDVRRVRDARIATYNLGLLTSEQIDEYLTTFTDDFSGVGTTPQAVRAYVDQVYDLGDLVTRPFILQMVVELVLKQQINVAGDTAVTATDLYRAYTEHHLRRDVRKAESRREFLGPEQRRRFAEECAIYMQRNDALEIAEDKLGVLARRACGDELVEEHGLDACLTDLRTTSLLTGAESRTLRFIHRSFQEYFFASTVRDAILESSLRPMCDRLPPQVLYFLGSYATTDDDFHQKLRELVRTPGVNGADRDAVVGNAAAAFLYSRERARDLGWRDITVAFLRRRNLWIDDSELAEFAIESLDVESLGLHDTRLDATIGFAEQCDLAASGCNGSLDVRGELAGVEVDSCDPLTLTINDIVESIDVDNSSVSLPRGRRSTPTKIMLKRSTAAVEVVAGDEVHSDRSEAEIALSERTPWSLDCQQSTVRLGQAALACAAGQAARSLVVVRAAAPDTPTHRMDGQKYTVEGTVIAAGVATAVPLAPGAADPPTVILGSIWHGDPKRDTFSGVRFQHDTRTDEGVPAEHVEGIAAGPQGLLVRGRGAPWHALERAIQRIERIQLDTPAEFAGWVLDTFTTALSDARIGSGLIEAGLAPARATVATWEA